MRLSVIALLVGLPLLLTAGFIAGMCWIAWFDGMNKREEWRQRQHRHQREAHIRQGPSGRDA